MVKKIAFMFLSINDHNQPRLWSDFLKNKKSKYNIYVHPKNTQNVKTPIFKNNIIDNIVETKYMYIIDAIYELFKVAIKDKDNYKFLLITNSCVPIKPFNETYNDLISTNDSYIDFWKDKLDMNRRYDESLQKNPSYVIQRKHFIKHSSYFSLNRDHLNLLLQKVKYMDFLQKLQCAEEHFLSILKAEINLKNVSDKIVTFADWKDANRRYKLYKNKYWKLYDFIEDKKKNKNENNKNENKNEKISNIQMKKYEIQLKELLDRAHQEASHPRLYDKITNGNLKQLKSLDSFFARKFTETSDINKYIKQIYKK
jgi:hypothetical protein